MILSPYFWIAVLLSALALFGTGYHNGYKHSNDHSEALKLQAVTKAAKKAKEQARIDQSIAQNYETKRETVRTVFIKIKEQANENIQNNSDYDNCGLDDIGLRIYNDHPRTAENPASGTNRQVPGSAGSPKREAVYHPSEQHRAIADVLRLPGAP